LERWVRRFDLFIVAKNELPEIAGLLFSTLTSVLTKQHAFAAGLQYWRETADGPWFVIDQV
jgi:hypothetical protein